MIDRMRAEHEAHRRGLSRRGVGQIDRLQVARRDKIDAGFVFGAQHQPAQADVGEAGLRVDDIVDGGGDIRPAVGAVLQMHRQPGHVGVVAGQHHRLAGRLGARHLENLRLVAKPPRHFLHQLVRLDAERRRDPRAAAHDVADQFRLLGTGGAKQHRLLVALHHLGDAGEIDRLVAGVEFGVAEALDEAAQPEPLEVHGIRAQVRFRLFRRHSSAHSLPRIIEVSAARPTGCAGNDRARVR